MNDMKGKYLITTDNWFYAPDGKLYRAVWGEVEILPDTFLGVKTNVRSSNWYAKVGAADKFVLLAGCQLHYAVKCPTQPVVSDIMDNSVVQGESKNYMRPTQIWIAE